MSAPACGLALMALSALIVGRASELTLGYLYIQSDTSWIQEAFSQMKLGVQDVNASATILPNHNLTYILADSQGQATVALGGAVNLTGAGVVGIIGTGYSSALAFPAGYCSMLQTPIVSPSSTLVSLTDKARYPFLLRSIASDAALLKSMSVIAHEFGWRRTAVLVNVDFEDGNSMVLRPALEALNISTLTLAYGDPDSLSAQARFDNILHLIASSGYRIILAYMKSVDVAHWATASQAAGLRGRRFVWLHAHGMGIPEITASTNIILSVLESSGGMDNPKRDDFSSRWPTVSTLYNASVHGTYDSVTKLPFFGANAFSPTVWDTDYAAVGDGVPDPWGMYVYDTVWLYALALHDQIEAGEDPHNGPALQQRLLGTRFHGITGEMLFDQDTQDRMASVQFLITRNGSEPDHFATSTDMLGQGSPRDGVGLWCATGCTDLTTTVRAGLPWAGGVEPKDGRELDPVFSSAFAGSSFVDGGPIEISLQVRDSFRNVPTFADLERLSLEFNDTATSEQLLPMSLIMSAMSADGMVTVTLPEGLQIDGVSDGRAVTLVVKYKSEELSGGAHHIDLTPPDLPTCGEGEGYDRILEACVPCPAGAFHRDLVCRGGLPCGCQLCQPGHYTASSGSLSCTSCAPGAFAETEGMTECLNCSRGSASAAINAATCAQCPNGSFTGEEGRTDCTMCATGKFAAGVGLTVCRSCGEGHVHPGLYTTLRRVRVRGDDIWTPLDGAGASADCGCDYGAQLDNVGECIECGTGLDCLGMGEVQVKPGYAWDQERLSVYKCYDDGTRCPGGVPGTCAAGRDNASIACSECLDGMTPGAGGLCDECGASDAMPFTIAVLCVSCVICVGYAIADRAKRGLPRMTALFVAILLSQIAAFIQQLGIAGMISISWEMPVASILKTMMLFNFDIEIIRPNCVATLSPLGKYAVRAQCVFDVLLLVCLVHTACVLARHGGRFRERLPSFVAAVGTGLLFFYLPVISTMLAPFLCQGHPNGQLTSRTYMSVTCWQGGQHTSMIAVGVCSLLLPTAFFAAAVWAIRAFPQRMQTGDSRFLHAWGFLVHSYTSKAYWFALCVLARNTLIAAAVVLYNPLAQIAFLQIVLMVSLAAAIYVQPWRVWWANLVETFGHMCMLMIMSLAAFLVDTDGSKQMASDLASAFVVLILLMLPAGLLFSLFWHNERRKRLYQFFLCHHKSNAGSFARCLKMHLLKTKGVSHFRKVFIDSDDLTDLDKLFDLVGYRTETLVVICSSEALRRPWCTGEIATANIHKLRAVPVLYHDDAGVAMPTDAFIDEYSSHVPDLTCLYERNITLEMVQDALRWLRELPAISVPHVSGAHFNALSLKLAEGPLQVRGSGKIVQLKATGGDPFPPDAGCVLIADMTDPEAMSTALILRQKLLDHAHSHPDKIPYIMPMDAGLPGSAKDLIVLCTHGVFQQRHVLDGIVAARHCNTTMLPILGDEEFRFPAPKALEELRAIVELKAANPEAAMALIPNIFHEIAIVFQPTHFASTEATLDIKAMEVLKRIMAGRSNRRTFGSTDLVDNLDLASI